MDALLKELEGKDIADVIAAGVSKLASVPSGGGGMAVSAGILALLSITLWPFQLGRPQCVSSVPRKQLPGMLFKI